MLETMTPGEARHHIDGIRRERFWLDDPLRSPSANPLMGMLRRALNQLATGIFEHAHHYVFELTQNADDNSYPVGADHFLKFVLLENDPTGTPGSQGCLCVLNDETGFEKKHVESLCDIGNSTKQGQREGYIGEKGIGFKSVFLISDRPHIISNGYSFHFRRDDCQAELGYIVPHWDDQVPAVAAGSPTAILLPLRSVSGVDVAKQLADIDPECILFLRRLRRIELVSAKTSLNRTVKCSGAQGFFDLDAGDTRASYFVHRTEHSCSQIHEPLREGVSSTSVTVALPLSAPETADGRVFAFLPTEARTGFPFLINADFLLPASRERILDTPEWNKQLVGFAAGTFVEAFDKLRGNAKYRTLAYRFIPTKADLLPGANLFAPLVEAVHGALKEHECVLTESGDCVLPQHACFAGPLSRRLLSEAPPKLANFRLVHPDLENHRKRLEPLGIQALTISEVLDICADVDWLRGRRADWWETLFDLLSRNEITAEAVSSFPLLRCQDGVCRRPSDGSVFIKSESQQTPLTLPPEWPPAHIFDVELQKLLHQKAAAWAWLTRVASLRSFSVQTYITGSLLDWMRKLTGEDATERLVLATHFVAANLKQPEEHHQTLREKMPWLLADKLVLLPKDRPGKELVTPECIEGPAGWNWVFISGHDRQHFWQLSNAYVDGQPDATRDAVRKLMIACGATDLPDPAKHSHPNGQIDWGCPRWLRDLRLDQPPQNLECKVAALERWIERFKGNFARFLTLSAGDEGWQRNHSAGDSQLGLALRNRPWLRSTKGLVSPQSAFADDPENRDFLRDSVAYASTKLPSQLLEVLGVRLRLSAPTLIELLRQMRDSGLVDEALIVRIYQRLQTMQFDSEPFRVEPLVFLSTPTARWMGCGQILWKDAGGVFDDEFGYVELTYGNEELHGFFTNKLKVQEEVSELQLAEVWAKMSGAESHPADIVEKRLRTILPSLANALKLDYPPDWWLPIRRRLKIWTTAQRFETAGKAFAPDDTFVEEVFAKAVSIAWVPKSHLTARLNRLLRDLGCRSLAENLRSRVANPTTESRTEAPRILTQATKELLICWVCALDGWRTKTSQLEQLLNSKEVEVGELSIEYWLEGVEAAASIREADAFWANDNQRLYLRHGPSQRAQQAAAASSFASRFGQLDKQGKDTVQCLLSLETFDGRRELADRKWELTPEQMSWIRNLGVVLEIIKVTDESEKQNCREARAAITPKTTSSSAAIPSSESPSQIAATDSKPALDAQAASQATTGSQPSSATTQTAGQANMRQQSERGEAEQDGRSAEDEVESVCVLKSADADTEFVHVSAHTRSRPKGKRQQREPADKASRDQHPMAGLTHATKMEIEEAAVQVVLRQFHLVPGLRDFKAHDERKRNHGYDVLAIKQGHALRIEIKAHLREAKSVFVTQKEWQQSRQRNGLAANDRWELWNVENLAADAGKVRITRYNNLPDEARTRESGYWVDLNACHSESAQ